MAEILEEIGLERSGAPGTTAALAMLNDQVKKGGIMASSYVGGLSGAFIPVSEDQGMIDAVSEGALTIEKLEAMTCVCSVGLDMIAIPGDTKATTIAGIIADEAAIGMINQKTTAVRLIPVIGKQWAIRQSSAVCLAMRRSFRSTVSPATTLSNVPDVSRHQYTALRTNRSFIWINHRN